MSLSEQLDAVENSLGLQPIAVSCDGGCGTEITRNDDRFSRMVGAMRMVLCPDCADDAGWVDE